MLRPFYDFGEQAGPWRDHFLYQPILHGDIRMLEYLWTLDPLKHRASQQPLEQLFRAAVEGFCYMRLPDWMPESLTPKHGCPLNKAKLKHHLLQPDFALSVWRKTPSKVGHLWKITDWNFTHIKQDCEETVKACLRDGEYWILTSECGVPESAGVTEPVLSRIFGDVAR